MVVKWVPAVWHLAVEIAYEDGVQAVQWYGTNGGRAVGCGACNEEFAAMPEHSADDDGIID